MRAVFLCISAAALVGQRGGPPPKVELLWPNGAPAAAGSEDSDRRTLAGYLPQGARSGTAVVVCPGGGYRGLAIDHEGDQIARWLNSLGVSAFVLKYRLGPRYHHPVQLGDVQRAIRIVRSRAAEIGVSRVGVWGFSAGGHLASTAATHFDNGKSDASDPIDRAGSRPDFAILTYPVITFTDEPYVHKGSRTALLGEIPIRRWSV